MKTRKSQILSHLETELQKMGYTTVDKQNDLFSLSNNSDKQRPILIRVIHSPSRIKREYQSHNNSPVKAIGAFEFSISTEYIPDFYIFTFINKTDERIESVIIGTKELFRRFGLFNHSHISWDSVLLILWLMQNNRLFDATHIGIEGEWYFMGGGMAEGTDMDFTSFWNNWDLLNMEK